MAKQEITSQTGEVDFPGADQAKTDWSFYQTYRSDTLAWRKQRDRMIQFAMGNQWSIDESDQLYDREQIDVVINMIRPLLRTAVALQISGKPTGVIYGKNVHSAGVAAILQDYLTWHWEESDGLVLAEKVVMGQNREGVRFYSLLLDKDLDFGNGELRFGTLGYNNVFVDRGSGANPDWSDAPRFIVSELLRPEDFYNRNIPGVPQDESLSVPYDEIKWSGRSYEKENKKVGTIQSVSNASHSSSLGMGLFIREMDIYERTWIDVPLLVQKATKRPIKVLNPGEELSDEDKKLIVKDPSKIPDELLPVGADGRPLTEMREFMVLEESEVRVKRINYRKNISGKLIVPNSEVTLPIDDYPIKPVIDEDTGNPEPLGEVDFQYGSNQLLNACMSLVLLNAAGSSNKKTLIDSSRAGMKIDFDQFGKQWSLPNAIIDMMMDPQTGEFPIKTIGPDPLNPAFFTLVQFFGQDIQFAGSLHSLRSGDPSQAPETAFALDKLGKWAEDTTRVRVNRHELGISKIFNLCLQWGAKHYTFEKFKEIVEEQNEVNEEGLAQKKQLTELDIVDAWQALQAATSLKTKFRMRIGSTIASESTAEAQILQQAAPGNPVLLKHIIRRLPNLRNSEKEEMVRDLDLVAQLQNQVRQQAQAFQVMQGEMQRLKEANEALEKRGVIARFENKVKESVADIEKSEKSGSNNNEK